MKFLVADVVRHVFNDEEDGGPVTWGLNKINVNKNKQEISSELSVACIVALYVMQWMGSPLYKLTLKLPQR